VEIVILPPVYLFFDVDQVRVHPQAHVVLHHLAAHLPHQAHAVLHPPQAHAVLLPHHQAALLPLQARVVEVENITLNITI
jgi:hypothetical protein